jgi:hypothetical protein
MAPAQWNELDHEKARAEVRAEGFERAEIYDIRKERYVAFNGRQVVDSPRGPDESVSAARKKGLAWQLPHLPPLFPRLLPGRARDRRRQA